MTTLELLKANPKSTQVIHDYYLNFMLDSLNDGSLPEEFKNFVREKGLEEHNLVEMIDGNSRNLFDVFDKQNIIIVIDFMPDLGLFGQFTAIVNGEMSGTSHSERKDADRDGLEMAIFMLEEKLTSLEKTNQDS